MPEDVVVTPESSTGTETPTETPATPETPAELANLETPVETPTNPVKAAIEKAAEDGNFAEVNRLLNHAKRQRMGLPTKESVAKPSSADSAPAKESPSSEVAESAPAKPVSEPDSGTGTEEKSKDLPPKETKESPANARIRELVAERNEWKRRAEQRQPPADERPASPKPEQPVGPFNEPEPDAYEYLNREGVEDLEAARKLWRKDHDAWMGRRDTALHANARAQIAEETTIAEKIRHRDAIYGKLDALSAKEGFENARQYFNESMSPFTDDMLRFYAEDEHGGEVLYHMILNPDKAETLCKLPQALRTQRLTDIRNGLVNPKSTPVKQTTDAPQPIRKQVTGRTEAPKDPLKAAREEGEKTGNWKKFQVLMNERKLARG